MPIANIPKHGGKLKRFRLQKDMPELQELLSQNMPRTYDAQGYLIDEKLAAKKLADLMKAKKIQDAFDECKIDAKWQVKILKEIAEAPRVSSRDRLQALRELKNLRRIALGLSEEIEAPYSINRKEETVKERRERTTVERFAGDEEDDLE